MINQKTLKEGAALEGRSAWYLVSAQGGKERLAVMQLRMQGFETYLPMRAPLKAGGAARPLFPAYLFVRVDMARPGWRAIYNTIGVKDVLSVGSGDNRRPKALPAGLVPGFMAMERSGLIPLATAAQGNDGGHTAPRADGLTVGDPVLMPFGAAGGVIQGVLAERVDARRGVVLISLLGRDSRATVDLASLARSSAVAVKG